LICLSEVIAEFDYEAKEDDELTLVAGDIITNVQPVSDGWCKGILRGKEGMFPDNFVKVNQLIIILEGVVSQLLA
jgi:Variant SH3 domain